MIVIQCRLKYKVWDHSYSLCLKSALIPLKQNVHSKKSSHAWHGKQVGSFHGDMKLKCRCCILFESPLSSPSFSQAMVVLL